MADSEVVQSDKERLKVNQIHVDPAEFSWLVSKNMNDGLTEQEAREMVAKYFKRKINDINH